MLPIPAHARRPHWHAPARTRLKERLNVLRSRSRATNLGVLLLSLLCFSSLLLNLRHWTQALNAPGWKSSGSPNDLSLSLSRAEEPITRVIRPPHHTNLTHLILVPCHSIFIGSPSPSTIATDKFSDSSWILAPFQLNRGRPASFWRHIEEGVRRAQKDDGSLLVFSGGQTSERTSLSEGESYYWLAELSGLFDSGWDVSPDGTGARSNVKFDRATTEVFALDSLQNLMFSVARFHEVTGSYPTKITIIGYEMKRERFTSLHIPALRFPLSSFTYIGIDLDPSSEPEAWAGEIKNALEPYKKDIYGCGKMLGGKRVGRNGWKRGGGYGFVLPEQTQIEDGEERKRMEEQRMVRGLLSWCPPTGRETDVYPGRLPWD